jgi:hypothetical protein
MTQTITLDYPITVAGKQVTELTMRRPNVLDHVWLEQREAALKRQNKALGDMEKDATLYARLMDIELDEAYQLDMTDLGKCRMYYLECVTGSNTSEPKTATS